MRRTIEGLEQSLLAPLSDYEQELRDKHSYLVIAVWPWEGGGGAYVHAIDPDGTWYEFYVLSTKRFKADWETLVSYVCIIREVSGNRTFRDRSLYCVEEILSAKDHESLRNRAYRRGAQHVFPIAGTAGHGWRDRIMM